MNILGVVTLYPGKFHDVNEAVKDHVQLPQFLPRTVWPSAYAAEESQESRKPPAHRLNTDIDWRSSDEREALRRRMFDPITGPYRHLRPMQPFDRETEKYRGASWFAHVVIVRILLNRTMQSSQNNLNTAEMGALVRIVSYGMHESMGFFEPYQFRGVSTEPAQRERSVSFEEAWNESFGMPTKLGQFVNGEDLRGSELCKLEIWGRRFVVVPVMYGHHQWGMTIFDRLRGELYIFDCGDAEFRGERIKSCVHFWIEFWNALGMAHTFRYFVPGVTHQPDIRDSGYLCIIWLMDMLRNQVGHVMNTLDDGVERADFDVCRRSRQEPFESGLYMRDWIPDGCGTPRTAIMGVRRIIRIMLCNELGLKTHEVMTKEYLIGSDRLPSAWTLISQVVEELRQPHNEFKLIDASSFWTGQGGPHFALPIRVPVLPYDPTQSRRNRRRRNDVTHALETRTEELFPDPGLQSPSWPDGTVYTPTHPITELRATAWDRQPGTKATCHLKLQGDVGPDDTIKISLGDGRWHLNRFSNQTFLKFDLYASLGDDDDPLTAVIFIDPPPMPGIDG
ncbi:hypothetical protein QQS21_003281 [Conoideocrella luteorostrata]|uniref:Uncharacterized protein n=1 Tax=Conoideocrella luteorostrata TaxID=1105319 RepID=A0AAJ0G0N0_9HYPO|nr:hypothetical protein QQS21_003281 [Conoideocrella luteorostrata]